VKHCVKQQSLTSSLTDEEWFCYNIILLI